MITLRLGSRDPEVRYLQRLLNMTTPNPRLTEDARFGPLTHAALTRFQQGYAGGLGRLRNIGICDSTTWAALGLKTEIQWPVQRIGQNTAMSCWVVAGGLASGRLSSSLPGAAQFDPTPGAGFGGLLAGNANVAAYAASLGMRLLPVLPPSIQGIEAHLRRGPAILIGSWIAGGAHAVVISGYYAASTAYGTMIRINNSLPAGVGSVELAGFPQLKLQNQDMDAVYLIVR